MANRLGVLTERKKALNASIHALLEPATGDPTQEQRAEATTQLAELATVNSDLDALAALHASERAQAGAAPAIEVHDLAADNPNPWVSARCPTGIGEFFAAVANAGRPGGQVDPRLYAAATGGSAGVPGEGGFLIRPTMSDMLLVRAKESAVLWPLCDNVPIGAGSDSFEAPYFDVRNRSSASSRFGGIQVYRRAEADTVTATKIDAFKKFELRLEDVMGLAYVTDRMLQDIVSFESWITNGFSSACAFKIDDELIRGNGAAQCLGILNAPALVSVAKETGQVAATIITENISKMWLRVRPKHRSAGSWYANVDTEPEFDRLALPVGTAALEPRFVTYGPDGILRIKGRPVVFIEHAETLGTKGDFFFADWKDYLTIDKGGMQQDDSIHVRFIYGERVFRFQYRFNGQPKEPGPITPYKGTATQSAFVALDTRA